MTNNPTDDSRPWSVFLIFLRLGLTSFGGPIAHLGYFRAEFVTRRRWLSERSYADLVALCQFLPGPASSQVGIAVGLSRAGYSGALAAWAGFTLPSAIALILFALGISSYGDYVSQGALHGLKVWLWPWSLKQYGAWRVTYARMGCESPSWQLLPASFYLCRPRGDRLA